MATQDDDDDSSSNLPPPLPFPSSLWAMLFGKTHLEVRRPSPTTVEFTVTTQPRRTGWAGWAISTTVLAVRLLLAVFAAAVVWVWYQLQVVAEVVVVVAATTATAETTTTGPVRRAQQLLLLLLDVVGHALTAAGLPPIVLLPLGAVAFWASVARVHTSESLLVLRGLGIQTRSTGATYLGGLLARASWAWWTVTSPWALYRYVSGVVAAWSGQPASPFWTAAFDHEASPASTTRFIPTEQLQDLLVNEAFRGFEVRYYLVAIVGDSSNGGGGGSGNGGGGGSGNGGGDTDDEDHIVVVFPRLLPGLDIVRTVWREARACLYEPPCGGELRRTTTTTGKD